MQLIQTLASFKEKEKSGDRPVVLVVDDQLTIQDMLSWMLYLQGYQPACAANGQEALEWLENALHTEQYPVAILLDLYMPVMNGASFLECLRADWNASIPIPPIILLTVDKHDQEHLACSDVLLKPFHINDLCESLGRITGKEPATW
jgi:two-component system chemotaxis response regulator CheY